MKKLINVLTLTLALNFLLLAGAVGWLCRSGHLDRQRTEAIREILFPHSAPATQQAASSTQPTTGPNQRLEQLLAARSGMSASEQVEYLQKSFDAQMIELDRKRRDAEDLLDQVHREREAVSDQRKVLATEQKKLSDQLAEASKIQNDKGFKESLERYVAMPGKTVKQIFMQLDDITVMNYLQAMPPRNAAQVIKEFKTPEEVERIHQIMEKMRMQASVKE